MNYFKNLLFNMSFMYFEIVNLLKPLFSDQKDLSCLLERASKKPDTHFHFAFYLQIHPLVLDFSRYS